MSISYRKIGCTEKRKEERNRHEREREREQKESKDNEYAYIHPGTCRGIPQKVSSIIKKRDNQVYSYPVHPYNMCRGTAVVYYSLVYVHVQCYVLRLFASVTIRLSIKYHIFVIRIEIVHQFETYSWV